MSVIDSVMAFVEGIKSMVDISGSVRQTLSGAISDGVESAVLKVRKPLQKTAIKLSFLFISIFFVIWGLAKLADLFVPYPGLGYIIVGALFGIAVLLVLSEKEQ